MSISLSIPSLRFSLKRRRRARWIFPTLTVLVLIALWDLAIRVFHVKAYIMPSPESVVEAMIADFPSMLPQVLYTTQEVLAGFGLSVLVGIPLALAIVSWPAVEESLYPLLIGSQVVPKIAIAPLFVIWFGLGIMPKIIIAFLIAFFPVVIDSVVGLRSIEIEKLYLARSMGATPLQTFFKIRLPNALPNIFGGLKLAITFAVTGALVGEFIGADKGVGRILLIANGNLDTAELFAALTLLLVVSVILFAGVELLEHAAVRWHVSQRGNQVRGA